MRRYAACALLLSLSLAACNDDKAREVAGLSDDAPVALEDALLYTTHTDDDRFETLLLDLSERKSSVTRAELPEGPPRSFARPAHPGEALVLTAGAPARIEDGKGKDAVPSHVLLFDRDGENKRFALSGSYSALALSEDGRFAIAHQPGGPWSTADSIALIDLDQRPSGEPIDATNVRALDGRGPSAVAFAPKDSKRRLAVLVMSDAINVIDLDHPERKDKVLPLKLPNGNGSLKATKVLFAGTQCFVQADRGPDIFAVSFEDAADGSFRATLSTFATEGAVSDIALLDPEPDGSRRLLAVTNGNIRLIDTKSGKGDSSSSGKPFTSAELFSGKTPFDDVERPRALLYQQGGNQIGFVDLQSDLVGSERTVEVLTLSASLASLTMVESAGMAIVLQSDDRISLVDLSERTVSSLSAGSQAKSLTLDQRPGVARAWVLTNDGSVGAIDLDERGAAQVLLTRGAKWLLPLTGESERLVVGHEANSGALTVLDAANPVRASAHEVLGFLYSHYLD